MPARGRALVLLRDEAETLRWMDSRDANAMATAYRQPNRLLATLRRIITSEYFPGKAWRDRKQQALTAGPKVLVIGSGVTHYPGLIHLDIDDFPGVDLVADAQQLPFQSGVLDGVLAEVVLEHVPRPQAVISETWRVLKDGGSAFFLVPFAFPYHGHPADFQRWSREGLKLAFEAFSEVEVGIHAGPSSALVNMISEWAYLASGMTFPKGYTLIKGLATLCLFPFKFLDLLIHRFPEAHRLAATFYVYVRK